MVVVDAGGSLVPLLSDVPSAAQLARADVVAQAFQLGGIDAMALSADDWKLGKAALLTTVQARSLPVLAANLTCGGEAPFAASLVVTRGERRIGIVGITDGEVPGCRVSKPGPALQAAVQGLGDVDVVVALLGTEEAGSRAALEQVSGIDLAFDAHGTRMAPTASRLGSTWVYGAGRRGQRVGLTTLSWVDGATTFVPEDWRDTAQAAVERMARRVDTLTGRANSSERYARQLAKAQADLRQAHADLTLADGPHHRVTSEHRLLDDEVEDEAATAALVAAFLRDETTGTFGAAPVVLAARVAPPGSPYAGAQACLGCHPAQHAQWETTPHARAWATLVADDHAADPSCISCHATGVGAAGGPSTPAEVAGLRDVQCEACHGAAAAHVAAPTEAAHRPQRTPTAQTCTACHDGERDMGRFDLPSYLPRVSHGAVTTP